MDTLATVPSGWYEIGVPDEQMHSTWSDHLRYSCAPVRRVYLHEYRIARTLVSKEDIKVFRGHCRQLPFRPSSPQLECGGAALSSNWGHAQAFCEQIGARLPFEAEWETACRLGILDADESQPRSGEWCF
ncbi:MAG: SUMF1/EgtB/PvdO family nonheme iron enzyme, partial [Fimbriimonadaceae bacterium]|nr:SUMF1/EgtB/PvdO family nonheme iron enzyme [Fimbriimonadaceae bacterium]